MPILYSDSEKSGIFAASNPRLMGWGRDTTYRKSDTDALFLVSLNLGNSKDVCRRLGGGDATGVVYIPRWCAEGISCPHAHLKGYSIYQRRGYQTLLAAHGFS